MPATTSARLHFRPLPFTPRGGATQNQVIPFEPRREWAFTDASMREDTAMPKFNVRLMETIHYKPIEVEASDKDNAREMGVKRWQAGGVRPSSDELDCFIDETREDAP